MSKPFLLCEERQLINVIERYDVTAIEERWATVTSDGASAKIPAELVYLMTGYTPTPGLLGEMGVPFHPETGVPQHNPETMETPIRGVFVCGVMTSGYNANGIFIENGRGHGALIARALVDRS